MPVIPMGMGPSEMPLAQQSSMQKTGLTRNSKFSQLPSTQVHGINEVCASASRQIQMKTVFHHHRQSDPTGSENVGPCLSLHPSSTLRAQMQQRDISIMLHRKKDRQKEGNRLAQDNRQPQQTKKSNSGLLTSGCHTSLTLESNIETSFYIPALLQ